MKLISITVTSSTKEAIIADALKSVRDWVDLMLIVHIEHGSDDTMQVAHDICKSKLRVVSVPLDMPFPDMRNAGLIEAERLSADWSVQLDTDERILRNDIDVRSTLAKVPNDIIAVTVHEDTGAYDKVRFIRHPTECRFSQSFHEELVPDPKKCTLSHIRFHELPKSPEQIAQRVEQQITACRNQAKQEPENPRWQYYLASALEKSKQYQEAILIYLRAAQLFKESEPKAWVFFRIACCWALQEKNAEAINAALQAMLYGPDYAEAPWLIAQINFMSGMYREAIAWAKVAAVHNWSRKRPGEIHRIGFKEPRALYEGPYQVMAQCYFKMGDPVQFKQAQQEAAKAARARIDFFQRGL